MHRYLSDFIQKDLPTKIVLLSGPRQVGKTTLAKGLRENAQYLNYDVPEHRELIRRREWKRNRELLILDEIHKMKDWKVFLKGLYDDEPRRQPMLITGSARLDIAKRAGDSLAGRHFSFRLHPFCVRELRELGVGSPAENFKHLIEHGGFPEPFLSRDLNFPARWRSAHTEVILRQDVLDLEGVRNLLGLETLVELLRTRVGTPVAPTSLAEDLDVSPPTVARWLLILQRAYIIFAVQSAHKNVARARKKAAKYYFFDNGQVRGDNEARFENLVALALLKEVERRKDCFGEDWSLQFLRDRDGREVDFLVAQPGRRGVMVECKWSDDSPHKPFQILGQHLRFPQLTAIQLVAELANDRDVSETLFIRRAADWLTQVDLELKTET